MQGWTENGAVECGVRVRVVLISLPFEFVSPLCVTMVGRKELTFNFV